MEGFYSRFPDDLAVSMRLNASGIPSDLNITNFVGFTAINATNSKALGQCWIVQNKSSSCKGVHGVGGLGGVL